MSWVLPDVLSVSSCSLIRLRPLSDYTQRQHTMSDSILQRVKTDLKAAMKAQDEVRRRTLRSLRAALANKEIEQRDGGRTPL